MKIVIMITSIITTFFVLHLLLLLLLLLLRDYITAAITFCLTVLFPMLLLSWFGFSSCKLIEVVEQASREVHL